MRSLFRFLLKHAFIVYFIILEVISLVFLFQENPYQRASILNSSDFIMATTYQAFDDIQTYLNLREVNQYLSGENSSLKGKSIRYFKKSFDRNVIYRDSSYEQEYVFHPAKVIRNSTNLRNNFLTLNRGEINGIEEGMGVVTDRGVVGVVTNTSRRFAVVMSVLNKDLKISAKVKKNNYFGSVEWNGENYRIGLLSDIPNHVSLVEGDSVITSGFSGIFPEGLPVGTIVSVHKKQGSGFLEAELLFSEDYRKLSYVHVIKSLNKLERKELESTVQKND